MIKYIQINIHGLNEKNLEELKNKIKQILLKEFNLSFDSDIEVEIMEYAGKEE